MEEGPRAQRRGRSPCRRAISATSEPAVHLRAGLFRARRSRAGWTAGASRRPDATGRSTFDDEDAVARRWRGRATCCPRSRLPAKATRCWRATATRWAQAGSATCPRPGSMAIPAARGSTRARRPAAGGAAARAAADARVAGARRAGVPPAGHLRPGPQRARPGARRAGRTASTCPGRCSAGSTSRTSRAA